VSREQARELPLRQAVALGLLHGPTELLPVSSSAHTALVPWLRGWRYGELDPGRRKSFEVALHVGTALGLLVRPPWDGGPLFGMGRAQARACLGPAAAQGRLARRTATLLCAIAPPAVGGALLGGWIERRLGTPGTIAAGLLAGGAAIGVAELVGADARAGADAAWRDGLALGAAQTLALAPGLSRSGMATAAARLRGFRALDADRVSWQVGLPVIAGAALLKGAREARSGIAAEERRALAAGAAAAFLSTCLSARLLPAGRRARLLPLAVAYRTALAAAVWARVARE
jgi:undecaprenyl-diphosphatase